MTFSLKIAILCVFSYGVNSACAVLTPSSFKICNREDPKLNKCLKNGLQKVMDGFEDGFPELNITTLDPLSQKEIKFNLQMNQLRLDFLIYNVTIRGFSDSKVHNVRADLQDDYFYMEADLLTKLMLINASYKADGNFIGFKLENSGQISAVIDDSVYTWKINGSVVTKNNEKYVKVNKFFMRPDIREVKNYLSDIIPGNPELSKLFLDFVNSNWRLLYGELISIVELTWGRVGKKYSNKIFSKIPYNQIFPEDDE